MSHDMEVKTVKIHRASKMEKVIKGALEELKSPTTHILKFDSMHPGSINKLCSLVEIIKREWLKANRKGLHQYNLLEKDHEKESAPEVPGIGTRVKVVPKVIIYLSTKKIGIDKQVDDKSSVTHQRPQKKPFRAKAEKAQPKRDDKTQETTEGSKHKRKHEEITSSSLGS